MFWKKRNKQLLPPLIVDGGDQREAFRYIFRQEDRPVIEFKGKTVPVLDISAGGLAFANGGFRQYDADMILLNLQMPNYVGDPRLPVQVRVLNITRNNVCHGIFESCSVEEYELIHKYVLEMQKKDLKRG